MGSLEALESPKKPPEARREPEQGPSRRSGRLWVWLLVVAAFAYGGWRVYAARAKGQTQDAQPAAGRGRAGNLVVPVVVATAERSDLPIYLNGLGTVTALNTVTVHSRVDGQLVEVAFKEGQIVHEGDALAHIDPRPFQVQLEQAEGQLARDTAQLHDSQANAARFDSLFREGVIPKQQADTQRAQVAQFEGAIKVDQAAIDNAKLQLAYSRITSPITGRVGLRLVDAGNIVHANDQNGLVVIAQLQPIAVLFSLPEDQLSDVYKKLRAGVQLPVEAYDRDNTTRIAMGKLLTIDNQIDTTTGTYKLKAIYGNEKNELFPNQFVNVHLLVDTKRGMTVIPAAAIQRGPQGVYVYVVAAGNVAKIRSITPAQTSGNAVGITAGIQPGEAVVIDGADKLQDGSKVEPRSANGSPTGNSAPRGGNSK